MIRSFRKQEAVYSWVYTEQRNWPPFFPQALAGRQGLPLQNEHLSSRKVICCHSWSLAKLALGKGRFVWFVDLLVCDLCLYIHEVYSIIQGKNQWISTIEGKLRLPCCLLLRLWNGISGNMYLPKNLCEPLPSVFAWQRRMYL